MDGFARWLCTLCHWHPSAAPPSLSSDPLLRSHDNARLRYALSLATLSCARRVSSIVVLHDHLVVQIRRLPGPFCASLVFAVSELRDVVREYEAPSLHMQLIEHIFVFAVEAFVCFDKGRFAFLHRRILH